MLKSQGTQLRQLTACGPGIIYLGKLRKGGVGRKHKTSKLIMHFALRLQAGLSASAFAINQKRSSQKLKIETHYFGPESSVQRASGAQ
jgi:hypothetical protein